MTESRDGIILIDKERFEHSSALVRRLKKILDIGKVGHSGTLDPFASGLLVAMVGRATSLARFFLSHSKRYTATVLLGSETDTLDPEGSVTRTEPVPRIDLFQVREAATRFVGRISQVPPAFSAIRCGGKRAYDLARKGLVPDLKARTATVHSLDILYAVSPIIALDIQCASGTYIRTLASDLARALSTVGHLIRLRRIECGPYRVEEAVSSNLLYDKGSRDRVIEAIIPMGSALRDMPALEVGPTAAAAISRGIMPPWDVLVRDAVQPLPEQGFLRVLFKERLLAVVRIENTNERKGVFFERVFPSNDHLN